MVALEVLRWRPAGISIALPSILRALGCAAAHNCATRCGSGPWRALRRKSGSWGAGRARLTLETAERSFEFCWEGWMHCTMFVVWNLFHVCAPANAAKHSPSIPASSVLNGEPKRPVKPLLVSPSFSVLPQNYSILIGWCAVLLIGFSVAELLQLSWVASQEWPLIPCWTQELRYPANYAHSMPPCSQTCHSSATRRKDPEVAWFAIRLPYFLVLLY